MTRIYTNILKDQDEYHYSWRLERYVRDGDEPLLGELAGKFYIQDGRFWKNRRKNIDDRRGRNSYSREMAMAGGRQPVHRPPYPLAEFLTQEASVSQDA